MGQGFAAYSTAALGPQVSSTDAASTAPHASPRASSTVGTRWLRRCPPTLQAFVVPTASTIAVVALLASRKRDWRSNKPSRLGAVVRLAEAAPARLNRDAFVEGDDVDGFGTPWEAPSTSGGEDAHARYREDFDDDYIRENDSGEEYDEDGDLYDDDDQDGAYQESSGDAIAASGSDDAPPDVDPEEQIFGKRVPFKDLGITDERLLKVLPELGFHGSTRIQAAAMPMILSDDRRAVVINGETGSGKTLCYLLPAIQLALRNGPRPPGCPCPVALIMVPGRELGYQVQMVAEQIASRIQGAKVSVYSARKGWPEKVPDILITTPRAAAQGLLPAQSEDELARREAIDRIRDVETVIFDEADLLLGGGSDSADVRAVLMAMAASYPDKPREVLPEAQVYYRGGVPVEVLDENTLEWKPAKAQWNPDGTFNCRFGPGMWEYYVRRSRLRGPGIGLLVENGPRVVMACATLPNYKRSRYMKGEQDNSLYNSGIGSPDWVIKRWFPNAVRVQSEWIHRRHPCIVKQEWVHIKGESKGGEVRLIQVRIQKLVELLKAQDPGVRTLVFANTPDSCIAADVALQGVGIKTAGIHAGLPLPERIEGLKKFAKGDASVIICTDLAARGIDLPVCRHVVQLEFAKNTVDHLHRVGRAARAGRLSKTTNFWGAGDVAVRDAVLCAPSMGLDGEVIRRRGNRGRLKRIRKKQRKQEMGYSEVRKRAREARLHTQSRLQRQGVK